jgi:hypothetical protein
MIPEVHACSGYLVITPKRAYRDNAGALVLKESCGRPLTTAPGQSSKQLLSRRAR